MPRCELEFDGCIGESVAMFKVRMLRALPERLACAECWRSLVGKTRERTEASVKNAPVLPAMPVRTPQGRKRSREALGSAGPALFATDDASRGPSR